MSTIFLVMYYQMRDVNCNCITKIESENYKEPTKYQYTAPTDWQKDQMLLIIKEKLGLEVLQF